MTTFDPDLTIERLIASGTDAGALARFARGAGLDPRSARESAAESVRALLTTDPHLALRGARRLAHLTRAEQDPLWAGSIQRLRGHALRASGRVREAVRAYERAHERLGRCDPAAADLTVIGWVQALAVLGRVDEAEERAAPVLRRLARRDPLAAARLTTNLANANLHAGRRRRALELYRKAWRCFAREASEFEAAHAAYGLVRAMLAEGRTRSARSWLERAQAHAGRMPVLTAYCDASAARIALLEGRSEEGLRALHELRRRLGALGDLRASAEIGLEVVELFEALGAWPAAAHELERSLGRFERLGSDHDVRRCQLSLARLRMNAGEMEAAEQMLAGIAIVSAETSQGIQPGGDESGGADPLEAEIRLVSAELAVARKDPATALDLLEAADQPSTRSDPAGTALRIRLVRAQAERLRGHWDQAQRALSLARGRRRHPVDEALRPRLLAERALLASVRGQRKRAVREAERAVAELETQVRVWRATPWIGGAEGALLNVLPACIDVVLDNAGEQAPRRVADMLARTQAPRLVEDLLRLVPSSSRRSTRRALAALRQRLIEGGGPTSSSRSAAVRQQPSHAMSPFDPAGARAPAVVRSAWQMRRFESWVPHLGAADLVWAHRTRRGWFALRVRSAHEVECHPLPRLEAVLRRQWRPLKLMLEGLAGVGGERRHVLLERTRVEASQRMQDLHDAFWGPLGDDGRRVHLVVDPSLQELPLEALALMGPVPRVVARLPHPALLGRSVPAASDEALLLHDMAPGARGEAARLQALLRAHGYRVRSSSKRSGLAATTRRLGVLHVAAHGVFHRTHSTLSGIRLRDGWLGQEHLGARAVHGALLVFSSCESGLGAAHSGVDLESWMTWGFASGARGLVLSSWKVDDAGSALFTGSFYPHWIEHRDIAAAVCASARRSRLAGEHPYRWAAYFASGSS